MSARWLPLSCTACLLLAGSAVAFEDAEVTAAGLRLQILEPQPFTERGQAQTVRVRVTNLGDDALSGRLRVWGADGFEPVGAGPQGVEHTFAVAAGEQTTVDIPFVAGAVTFRALYPIHAEVVLDGFDRPVPIHTVRVVSLDVPPVTLDRPSEPLVLAGAGAVPLAQRQPDRVLVAPFEGEAYPFTGLDPRSRANFSLDNVHRGERRTSVTFHPPWAPGMLGTVVAEYRVTLPEVQPITFTSGLAIRDNTAAEPPSDGVTFRVEVVPATGPTVTAFAQHTAAKTWQDVAVDLTPWAGQTITLRLIGDPGPARDTTCDQAYWGAPVLRAGPPPPAEDDTTRARRAAEALAAAQAALAGNPGPLAWTLRDKTSGDAGAAVVLGPRGLVDAQLAFATPTAAVVFDGYTAEVGGAALGTLLAGDAPVRVRPQDRTRGGAVTVDHQLAVAGRPLTARVELASDGGALRLAWSMPDAERDARGEPRYTRLALGAANHPVRRVYFGHGHVLVEPEAFSVGYNGFQLSTRHVGVDYANGLSLLTAGDPVPDAFEHDGQARASLVAHLDATFTLLPTERGAMAAARAWRGINGLQAAPGVADIAGRMCLDQWGGDYADVARDLRLATAYGLDDAVYLQHVWQRWGYDYRLPDIYPPAGNWHDFQAMAEAARLNGRLFAIHDNYIDFYPDATGFSYDHILFNADGTPQLAWYNEGRQAQSYRWSPVAFMPFLEANLRQVEQALDPGASFIDVFSAIGPMDFHDRAGRFYPKTVTVDRWGEAFDRTRQIIGGPTISEAGHDALIGHLDAAEADHPPVDPTAGSFGLRIRCAATDRVPWFDMAHHGRFVLLAGGLGSRYAADRDNRLHGYGSDDYLSLTVLGGRTAMCDGPFHRRTVMTYWLLQPLTDALERQDMLAHAFDGDEVRRQRVTWSDGEVVVNRGPADWTVDGQVLPEYGFVARAGEHTADITRRDGVISALAQGNGVLFADARPPDDYQGGFRDIRPEVLSFEDLGNRRFRLRLRWDVREPVEPAHRVFVHLTGPGDRLPGWQPNGDILFQASSSVQGEQLAQPGVVDGTVEGTLPELLTPGPIGIRYGVYHPETGVRLPLVAPTTSDGRHDGGTLIVTGEGEATTLTWQPPAPVLGPRTNTERRVLDFGPVATNGAVRLEHTGDTWTLTLLPGSLATEVVLHLDQLGAAGRRITEAVAETVEGRRAGTVPVTQDGNTVRLTTADRAFRYRLAVR